MASAIRARLFAEDQREQQTKKRPASTRACESPPAAPPLSPEHQRPAAGDSYREAGRLVRKLAVEHLPLSDGGRTLCLPLAVGKKCLMVGPQLWAALPKIQAWTCRAALGGEGEGGAVVAEMPADVAVCSETEEVLLAEPAVARVAVYSADGTLLRTIGAWTSRRGPLQRPTAVAVDSQAGTAVVYDAGPGKLLTYTLATGALVRSTDVRSLVSSVSSIALDGPGKLAALADPVAKRVVVLRLFDGGCNLRLSGPFSSPAAVAFDQRGSLLVADAGSMTVTVHDPSAGAGGAGLLATIGPGHVLSANAKKKPGCAGGLCVDPAGHVLLAVRPEGGEPAVHVLAGPTPPLPEELPRSHSAAAAGGGCHRRPASAAASTPVRKSKEREAADDDMAGERVNAGPLVRQMLEHMASRKIKVRTVFGKPPGVDITSGSGRRGGGGGGSGAVLLPRELASGLATIGLKFTAREQASVMAHFGHHLDYEAGAAACLNAISSAYRAHCGARGAQRMKQRLKQPTEPLEFGEEPPPGGPVAAAAAEKQRQVRRRQERLFGLLMKDNSNSDSAAAAKLRWAAGESPLDHEPLPDETEAEAESELEVETLTVAVEGAGLDAADEESQDAAANSSPQAKFRSMNRQENENIWRTAAPTAAQAAAQASAAVTSAAQQAAMHAAACCGATGSGHAAARSLGGEVDDADAADAEVAGMSPEASASERMKMLFHYYDVAAEQAPAPAPAPEAATWPSAPAPSARGPAFDLYKLYKQAEECG